MNTKNITKFVVAVALTLAVTLGSGIAAEQFGYSVTPTAQAGPSFCPQTGSGGGGC